MVFLIIRFVHSFFHSFDYVTCYSFLQLTPPPPLLVQSATSFDLNETV